MHAFFLGEGIQKESVKRICEQEEWSEVQEEDWMQVDIFPLFLSPPPPPPPSPPLQDGWRLHTRWRGVRTPTPFIPPPSSSVPCYWHCYSRPSHSIYAMSTPHRSRNQITVGGSFIVFWKLNAGKKTKDVDIKRESTVQYVLLQY